jgi:ankyrin repeat protein
MVASTGLAFAGPIHDAARKGDVKKIQALLQQDPKMVKENDNRGDTPLHVACLHGQVAAVQALLDAGADVNAKNSYGAFLPEDLGKEFGSSNQQDPVWLLGVKGNDARAMSNGYTPLDLAIFSTKHHQLLQILVAKNADVNAQAASGSTPLFWAVMRDQKDDVQFLLDHGANPNQPDVYKDTILDVALHMKYQSLVPLLVDKGADVNAQDQSLHRPLTYAEEGQLDSAADYLKKRGAHE